MQLFNKLEKIFDTEKVSCIWNDIVKIGKSKGKGTPPREIIEWQDEWFKITKQEIEILKENQENFKEEIEKNKEVYEKMIDDAAEKIETFIQKASSDNQIQ